MNDKELEKAMSAIGGEQPAGGGEGGGDGGGAGNGGEVDYKARCAELEKQLQSAHVEGGRVKKLDGELKEARARIAELEQNAAREAALGELPEELKDVPDDIKNTSLAIAQGLVKKAMAGSEKRMKELEERVNNSENRRSQQTSLEFAQKVNAKYPGFFEAVTNGGDKKEAWDQYQIHNLATIQTAIRNCDFETLSYHIGQFYKSIDQLPPSGGQDGSAAPDPRAMGGGANTQTVGIQPGKTYSVQEWCQIRDEAQAKFQSQKISYKDYAAICDELTKAHREGRVK